VSSEPGRWRGAPRWASAPRAIESHKASLIEFGVAPRNRRQQAGGSACHPGMKVTDKDVGYVADLANLELSDEEHARMVRDLNSILDYVDRLNRADTSNVEAMGQVSEQLGRDHRQTDSERFAYASREDVIEGLRKSLPREVALENAPDADDQFFEVPKVIER
jgi:aspartyl-tRNA(Asn)/glutamyl-tRNA(Gln) amidotransferase subunit C